MARAVPTTAIPPLAKVAAAAAMPFLPARHNIVARHMQRAAGTTLPPRALRRVVRASFASYGRYWLESLRLPAVPAAEVDATFSIEGLEHIEAARAEGRGAVLALPHVGGWDAGGAWLVRQGFPLTVVVEPLEPPELLEWFVDLRRNLGFTVIPLDLRAGAKVLRSLRDNEVVALLCDRDIGGGGVDVEFFGEKTTLPGGPATVAKRAKTVLLPTAVYFDGKGHHAVVRRPVALDGDVVEATQRLAQELEALIRRAPDQWHLFQPNWPSDRKEGR